MSESGTSSDQVSVSHAGRRFAVIGGGISGLAAAFRLQVKAPEAEVVLFERADRCGGILGTRRVGDWLIEQAADMMTTEPSEAVDLCRELGIEDRLIPTSTERRGALVWFAGRLHRVPDGFSLMAPADLWPLLRSGLLTWRGKLRLAAERFVKPRNDPSDESFESFALRRCGREAYERLVQPLVSGIYTADPKRLSMRATSLRRFVEMERRWGSLGRGLREAARGAKDKTQARATGARYGLFVAPQGGMQELVDALVKRLGQSIRMGSSVESLRPAREKGKRGWAVLVDGEATFFDGVVLATSAPAVAPLVVPFDYDLAHDLEGIEHASCAVVVLGLRKPNRIPPAFGAIVPTVAGRPMIAAALASNKFPGRAPQDGLLVRVFFGGALNEAIVEREDAELIGLAERELREVLGLEGTTEVASVVRWRRAMPQYHVGHDERVARIERRVASWQGLALAGNAYRGVGIPDCIRSGTQAALSLLGQESNSERSALVSRKDAKAK